MEREHRSDRFTAIEDQYAGYEVYDRNGEKIGKVDDLFVDENDQPEYLGVKMGFLGLEGTSLIPWELTRVNGEGHRIEVSVDKAQVKESPSFNDDEDITPKYEERVYSHYGLQRGQTGGERGSYSEYYADEQRGHVEHDRDRRHEEVSVERVPVEGREASEAEIGEDEVSMPVVEEEVVVEKRPVVKEEFRIRKDVVEDEEIVEEDVRKEEVDVEDATTTRGRSRDAGLGDETGRRGR